MQRDPNIHHVVHQLAQGSDEWHTFRSQHNGASEAAAMLGLSDKVTRDELVRMKATGLAKEFSDWVQEKILDHGHEVEALARPLAEKVINDSLYPVTCSLGRISASCDGLTICDSLGWEHKQWNEQLAAAVAAGEVPDTHMPQVQQELMVTGAEKWMFMVSDGTEANRVWTWVYPDTSWFARIVAGWEQFDADVASYTQVNHAVKPEAAPATALPALVVQTEGKVVSSNLMAYQKAAEKFLATIKTDLQDDQDFADAEYNVKFCGEAEQKLELAKAAALAQTSTIDEVMRTVDHIKAQFRAKRLELEKLVKVRKEQIKETILNEGRYAYQDHVVALEEEIAPLKISLPAPDFAGAMKNKRTLASLHDAANTTLANAKIAASQAAADLRAKLAWYNANVGDHAGLFRDLQQLSWKAIDDFQLVVRTRIADHIRAEEVKQEALRARIAAEEKAKAEAAAAEKLAAERKADADRQAAAAQAERDRVAAEQRAQQAAVATQARPTTAAAAVAQAQALAAAARTTTPPASGAADVQRTASFYRDAPLASTPAPAATGTTAGLFDVADREVRQDIDFLNSLASSAGMQLAALLDRLVIIDIATLRAELRAAA
ncbi:endonuclease [Duganella sp. FT80W]|uniref:Endonuclease n=1 Tax=Duganella guangzhouensis TaxID=2666084 RepID=A0A6I2KX70_9BURK|nr:YqaJ viral recombinase family protein [Duganella guangzhouensis]MRW88816.1 endonuclease [Duganella guangzhouensis]